jgi:hypothetical protein
MKYTLENGEVLEGILHEDFGTSQNLEMVGKFIDLEAAYKQCPIAPSDTHCAVFAAQNPDTGEPDFFIASVLPFGASASVHAFNRVATALNHLLHAYLDVPCTNYFDDFTIIVPASVATGVAKVAKEFMEALGWRIKEEKEKPFRPRFEALGVVIDVSQVADRFEPVVIISNKPERVAEIQGKIEEVLDTGRMSQPEAAELRGRLVFSNSQVFGRQGAMASYYLTQKAEGRGGGN